MKKQIVTIIATTVILFFISSCAKEDTTPITCPKGYTGSDCKQQITPSKIRITKIEILKFPCTTSLGNSWDIGFSGNSPELYVIVAKGTTPIFVSNYYTDADCALAYLGTYSFVPSTPIEILSPNDQYTFELDDNDSPASDEFIGAINATLYSSTTGFPSTYIMDNGDIKIRLTLEYLL